MRMCPNVPDGVVDRAGPEHGRHAGGHVCGLDRHAGRPAPSARRCRPRRLDSPGREHLLLRLVHGPDLDVEALGAARAATPRPVPVTEPSPPRPATATLPVEADLARDAVEARGRSRPPSPRRAAATAAAGGSSGRRGRGRSWPTRCCPPGGGRWPRRPAAPGTPFQCRTSTSGTKVGCAREAATLVTRKRSAPPSAAASTHRSTRNGRKAVREPERGGQQVVGVQVAHRGEDVGQLAVELHLRAPGLLGQRRQPVAQQPQPLHRVDRVHRPLEHQVHVALLDHHQCLVDEQQAVGQRERAVAHAAEEVAQQRRLGGAGRCLGQNGGPTAGAAGPAGPVAGGGPAAGPAGADRTSGGFAPVQAGQAADHRRRPRRLRSGTPARRSV